MCWRGSWPQSAGLRRRPYATARRSGATPPGGPDHAVLDIVVPAAPKCLRHGLDHALLILGVDQCWHLGEAEELCLRLQPKDAIGFIRPGEAIRLGVVLPVADVREALGLFEFALAVA